jgi:hypothetical protein
MREWQSEGSGSTLTGRARLLDLALIAACVLFVILSALGGPFPFQSDHRLFPLFLFANGKAVYCDPTTGPIAPSLYPPLSFLAYFPALFFRRPSSAIFCAKLVAQCYTVAPILWLLWFRRARDAANREKRAILTLTVLMLIFTSDLLSFLTILHADAPALFLSFCACVLTERFLRSSRSGMLLAAALCCAAAPWAKQPAAPIVLVPLVVLLMVRRWKALAGFSAAYVAFQMLLVGLFFYLFRGQQMFFWLFQATSKQLRVINVHIAYRLLGDAPALVWILLVIVGYALLSRFGLFARGAEAEEVHLEDIFLLASLVEIPSSIAGYLFPGGAYNALLYFALPASLFTLLWLQGAVLPHVTVAAVWRAAVVIGVACAMLSYEPVQNAVSGWSVKDGPDVDIAYRFMRAHPGEVWFPRYPLTSYLAEGRIYHSEMGFFNLEAMGIPITESHLLAYVPNGGRLIACTADCGYLRISLDGYRQIPFAELPGHWNVYEKMDAVPLDGAIASADTGSR